MFGKKNKQPLAPKPKEEMPYKKEGLTLKELRKKHKKPFKWRTRRWSVLIGINLLFFLSF
ncbi:MAG: NapH/MauN family ferredoxin-type protein, partial [Gammaproteobacteria bacterium]